MAAPDVVQSVTTSPGNSESAFGTVRSDSFASLPTVGNHVVVTITNYHATIDHKVARVVDNQTSNFYNRDMSAEFSTAETSVSVYCAKVNVSSGTFTISWNPTDDAAGSNYANWNATEISGMGGASMPDFIGAVPGAIQTATTSNTGSITRTVTAGSIWVVMMTQTTNASRSYTIAGGGLTWSDTIGATTLIAQGSTNFHEVHMWYAYDATGGSRTATITVGGGLTATFVITDLELGGIDTSTPGDVAAVNDEAGTNTSHTVTGQNTSSNCGLGIVWSNSESGNYNDCEPSHTWNKLLGGDNTVQYYLAACRTNGALTGETGEFSHATAREGHTIMAFFKAATAATSWFDKSGTNSSATGDANVTASGANAVTDGIAIAVAGVLCADTDINISDTPPTDYAHLNYEENSSAIIGSSAVYKRYTASETSAATWTHDNTSQSGWVAGIATYRGVVAAGGAVLRFLGLLGAGQ